MTCPVCNGKTLVCDSRFSKWEEVIKRRRKCKECGYRFNTYEIDEDLYFKLGGKHNVKNQSI